MVLFKLLNHAIFDDLNGCISTGKQANVYHATKHDGQEFAVKVFKDRNHNIQGDYRFRHVYCKHNSRKMAKTWAENEMRNLMRLRAAGIRCPTPILLRLHVLVMEFIDFSRDGSVSSTLHSCHSFESEMRAKRLSLLDEIGKIKIAEDALGLMYSQWQRVADLLLAQTGLTFSPDSPAELGLIMFYNNVIGTHLPSTPLTAKI